MQCLAFNIALHDKEQRLYTSPDAFPISTSCLLFPANAYGSAVLEYLTCHASAPVDSPACHLLNCYTLSCLGYDIVSAPYEASTKSTLVHRVEQLYAMRPRTASTSQYGSTIFSEQLYILLCPQRWHIERSKGHTMERHFFTVTAKHALHGLFFNH